MLYVVLCGSKDPSEEDEEDEEGESLLDEMDDDLSNQNSRFLQQKPSSATLPIRAPTARPVRIVLIAAPTLCQAHANF